MAKMTCRRAEVGDMKDVKEIILLAFAEAMRRVFPDTHAGCGGIDGY